MSFGGSRAVRVSRQGRDARGKEMGDEFKESREPSDMLESAMLRRTRDCWAEVVCAGFCSPWGNGGRRQRL
jgi:hypothetical protein